MRIFSDHRRMTALINMDNTATSFDTRTLPPMLISYLDFKQRNSDALLLFQVGDFYEAFFDDAIVVSKALNLTLTTRDKNSPEPVPMCGVPMAVVDNYVDRLIQQGYSAALVMQVEHNDNGKRIISRKLERIVTPGIRLLNVNSDNSENIIASVFVDSERDMVIASCDVQSGKIYVREGVLGSLRPELAKLSPAEIILPRTWLGKSLDRRTHWVKEIEIPFRSRKNISLKFRSAQISAERVVAIPGYSILSNAAKNAVALLLNYIDETTVDITVPLSEICVSSDSDQMILDANTRDNLELVRNLQDGSSSQTLYAYLNFTRTVGGGKLLKQWILNPLLDKRQIEERQDVVQFLMEQPSLKQQLFSTLECISDLERIAARIELQVSTPRELGALRDALQVLPGIRSSLAQAANLKLLQEITSALHEPATLLLELASKLQPNLPAVLGEGGIIADGVDSEVDHLRQIRSKGKTWLSELEEIERKRTGISSLKIKYNNVFGYFIEVTQTNLSKVPVDYTRKQTTANGERYITEALKQREVELLGAEERLFKRERELFEELRKSAWRFSADIRRIATNLHMLDCLNSLAEASDRHGLVRPEILQSHELYIEGAVHPVVSSLMAGRFVANNHALVSERGQAADKTCAIITGANMGGKSTYLRQLALIVIMAQLGCFVSARSAKIGLVDRIFARIGASDNLHEGESTFMVEMREAAHILHNASARSLLLVDEIGRGTATSDGLALAQAFLEWILVKLKSRTLFATHFHELTELAAVYKNVINLSVGSLDSEDGVVFTHEIQTGPASRSYGIEVARLAGLPQMLISRASALLGNQDKRATGKLEATAQMSLFSGVDQVSTENADTKKLRQLKNHLLNLEIDRLTPVEALLTLDSLIKELRR